MLSELCDQLAVMALNASTQDRDEVFVCVCVCV